MKEGDEVAKYAISKEGVEALNQLANDLLINANNIVETNQKLEQITSSLYDNLGIYGDEIVSIVQQTKNALNNNKEEIIGLANRVKKQASEIESLMSMGIGESTASSVNESSSSFLPGVGLVEPKSTGQLSNNEWPHEKKTEWIQSVVSGADANRAESIVNSMEWYSSLGYEDIHNDKEAKKEDTQNILQVFDSHNVGTYGGVIYRGLSFGSKRELMNALAKGHGDWNEPGITSFSADMSIAEDFATRKEWGLILKCDDNKSAIPFRHISKISWEDEVLSPGGLRNDGWKLDMNSVSVDERRHIVYVNIHEK